MMNSENTFKPYVSYTLIGLNLAVFALMALIGGIDTMNPSAYHLYQWGGFMGEAIAETGEYWRFISSLFVHAGLLHLAVNLISLYNVGPTLEYFVGRKSFLAIYFLSGLFSGLNVFIWSPDAVAVGASGAIFGVFAALAGIFIRYRRRLGQQFFKSFMKSFILVVGINLAIGLSIPNISNAGHIGGMVGGFMLGLMPMFSKQFNLRTA